MTFSPWAGALHLVTQGAEPMAPEPARVRSVRREAEGVVTLVLDPPARGGGPAIEPGQFNMLYAFGVGEVPISTSGDAAVPDQLVHTVREVGAVTRAICAARRGDVLGVRGPFGTGWPLAAARGADLLIVAGGLGIAPLRPAVLAVLRRRDEYGRVALLYGARHPADIVYGKDLDRWRARRDIQVLVTVDRAEPSWTEHVGVVPALIRLAGVDPARTVAMLCGPEVMMRFTVRELEARGIGADRIWVSLERSMKCAVGFCGHCQLGPHFVCKDGPVLRHDRVGSLLGVREL